MLEADLQAIACRNGSLLLPWLLARWQDCESGPHRSVGRKAPRDRSCNAHSRLLPAQCQSACRVSFNGAAASSLPQGLLPHTIPIVTPEVPAARPVKPESRRLAIANLLPIPHGLACRQYSMCAWCPARQHAPTKLHILTLHHRLHSQACTTCRTRQQQQQQQQQQLLRCWLPAEWAAAQRRRSARRCSASRCRVQAMLWGVHRCSNARPGAPLHGRCLLIQQEHLKQAWGNSG
jgi:hypothetical protein